jgi:hypothetical protein
MFRVIPLQLNPEEENVATQPTYEQGRLQLELYDLRREAKLRQARDWFFKNVNFESFEESMRVIGPGSEGGANFMMVLSYWDQAAAYLNHGLLHEDLFFETSGEFFGVWEQVKNIIPAGRQMFKNPGFLANLEKTAKRFEEWQEKRNPGAIAAMRQMMQQFRPKPASTAKTA